MFFDDTGLVFWNGSYFSFGLGGWGPLGFLAGGVEMYKLTAPVKVVVAVPLIQWEMALSFGIVLSIYQ